MKIQYHLRFFCTVIMISSSLILNAQSDPPPFGGSVSDEPEVNIPDPPAFEEDVADLVPIDGGLTLLLAAGVAFGARKANQYRKLKAQ